MGTAKKARSKTTKEPEAAAVPSTPAEKLFGMTLLRKAGAEPEPTMRLLQKKQLVALYFAAADDATCQTFTKRLVDFYTTTASANDGLEIVYVSSDKKLKDFEVFFGEHMPWLSLGTTDDVREIKTMLAKSLAVSEIPFLVVLDVATGQLVADVDCVKRVQESTSAASDRALLDEWKAAEPRDVREAVQSRVRADLTTKNFIKTLVRNVIIMFVVLQVGTAGMKKVKTLLHGGPPPWARASGPSLEERSNTKPHTEF